MTKEELITKLKDLAEAAKEWNIRATGTPYCRGNSIIEEVEILLEAANGEY